MGFLLLVLAGLALLRWGMQPSVYAGTSPAEFVAWLGPQASDAQIRTGIPASVVTAQGALESGWGKSRLARETNNLFGVKAGSSWAGQVVSAPTWEVVNGQRIEVPGDWRIYANRAAALAAGQSASSLFRVYRSAREALIDQARVYYNGLYEPALAHRRDAKTFINLAGPRYATDPAYSSKVLSIMHAHQLERFDVPFDRWNLDAGVVPPRHLATWAAAVTQLQEQQA